MRILLLTDGIYPYTMGGMQKHSYYLTKYLAQNNINVTLFHCTNFNSKLKDQGADLNHFNELELKNIDFRLHEFPKLDRFPGHYVRENKAYSKSIYQEIKDSIGSYDLIYAQGFTGWQFIKEKKSGRINIPVVINFHGYEMFQKAPSIGAKLQYILLKHTAKWMSLNADFAVSLGGKLTTILQDLGVPNARILVTPIGVESSWLNKNPTPGNEIRKFVFIGRYERRKGIEELNKSLQQLIDKGVDFEFNFIGPVPKEKQLITSQVIYYGKIVNQEEIQRIVRQCDALVCPSHSEGMPTVILEAMASGLAIIATNVGAVKEQIKGNGWLLESISSEKLSEVLIECCQCEETQLSVFKKASIKLVSEKFLWNKTIELTLKQFSKILKKTT